MSFPRTALIFLISFHISATAAEKPDNNEILLEESVPASGISEIILKIPSTGRYAVKAESKEKVSLQIVDRMTGPGPVSGTAGSNDGRIDAFFEPGEYKLIVRGHPPAKGQARITVHPFREKNVNQTPFLEDYSLTESSLGDLEQRSYWIKAHENEDVIIEVAGRNLADLRLWQKNRWILDTRAKVETIHPLPGRPLRVFRISARLPAGIYLLSAYGGEALEWSETSDEAKEHPLYIRCNIPLLPSSGRNHKTVSPFGIDRFRLPPGSNFARMDFPEAVDASIELSHYNSRQPFTGSGRRVSINKNSMPHAESFFPDARNELLLTVRADAGKSYLLQYFPPASSSVRPPFKAGSNRYMLSTIHSGHPDDMSDATGVLVRTNAGLNSRLVPPRKMAHESVMAGPEKSWRRRFDLQGRTTVHLNITAEGTYRFDSDTGAEFRVEPFMLNRPSRYNPPPFKESGASVSLGSGLHVLTVRPKNRGLANISFRFLSPDISTRILPSIAQDLLQSMKEQETGIHSRIPSITLHDIKLNPHHTYSLYTAERPGSRYGIIIRNIPVNMKEPLPISLKAGESLEIPVITEKSGIIRAKTDDGSLLPVSINGKKASIEQSVQAGQHMIRIHNSADKAVFCTLDLEKDRPPLPDLPLLSDFISETQNSLPVLKTGEKVFFNIERENKLTFLIHAKKPGLYTIESTGLLDTEVRLGSRIRPDMYYRQDGGSGRNFGIREYLREGEYRLIISTRGRSEGRFGLSMSFTPIIDGGMLRNHIPMRAGLNAGEGIRYQYISETGAEYNIQSIGRNRIFRIRLEDEEGWPIIRPGAEANLNIDLHPGRYNLIILPENVFTRRVSRLSMKEAPLSFSGHGPHTLPLDRRIHHTWRESPVGKERAPDIWNFHLSAASYVRIDTGPEMEGVLLLENERLSGLPSGEVFSGRLEAGSYSLKLRCRRVNDHVPYSLKVKTETLIPGSVMKVRAPADIGVATGSPGLIKISSFGRNDVSARFFDSSGRLIMENDERPDDWNFLLSGRLESGDYLLRVNPVGEESAMTSIRMEMLHEITGIPLSTPFDYMLHPGDDVHLHTVNPDTDGLLVVSAKSKENIESALEFSCDDESWKTIVSRRGRNTITETPLQDTDPENKGRLCRYRIRIRSMDRSNNPVHLKGMTLNPGRTSEKRLSRGIRLQIPDSDSSFGAARISPERAGLLRIINSSQHDKIRWTDRMKEAAQKGSRGFLLRRANKEAWLIRDLKSREENNQVQIERVFLSEQKALTISIPPFENATVDIDPDPGRGLFSLFRKEEIPGPVMIRARAGHGYPGIIISDRDTSFDMNTGIRPVSMKDTRALTISLEREKRVLHAWNSCGKSVNTPTEMNIALSEFSLGESRNIEHGIHEGKAQNDKAPIYILPEGLKRLRLNLDNNTACALVKNESVISVHGGLGMPVSDTLVTSADRLIFVPVDIDDQALFGFEILPVKNNEYLVAEKRPFEMKMRNSGFIRLEIPKRSSSEKMVLRYLGAVNSALLVANDGTVAQGETAVPKEGGILHVMHDPGYVMVWLESDNLSALGFPDSGNPVTHRISSNSLVNISESLASIHIETESETMMHIRSATPVAINISGPGSNTRSSIHPDGLIEDVFFLQNKAHLLIRSLGKGREIGSLSFIFTNPVPVDEGLGPKVLLGPGESRSFSFITETEGKVGVGVNSASDTASVIILDSSGMRVTDQKNPLKVSMLNLQAGLHVLVIRADMDNEPFWVRPAIAGLKKTDKNPPEDILKSYLGERRNE